MDGPRERRPGKRPRLDVCLGVAGLLVRRRSPSPPPLLCERSMIWVRSCIGHAEPVRMVRTSRYTSCAR